jgi:hypothetical protein
MGCFCYEKRALRVWSLVFRWVGIGFITPLNLFVHLALVWVILKARNDPIFKNRSRDFGEIVDEIKVVPWKCSLARRKGSLCLSMNGIGILENVSRDKGDFVGFFLGVLMLFMLLFCCSC